VCSARFAGLVFMGVIGFGDNWYVDPNPGWFGGQWWWIAVTAGAGVLVGLFRRVTHLPEKTSGLIADLQDEQVDPRPVPGIVAVSAVSLIGGASLLSSSSSRQPEGVAPTMTATRITHPTQRPISLLPQQGRHEAVRA
jgi:hypothetical protein